MTDQPGPRTWPEVRGLATTALRDNLAFCKRTLPGVALTGRGQTPQYDEKRNLICHASRSGIKWTEQQYFLVRVGDNPRTLHNRHDLELFRFSGQRLHFAVPPATRKFLASIADSTVQIYYIDNLDVQLKTQLLKVLQKVEKGPLVPSLWDAAGPVKISPRNAPGETFNAAQRSAYAAMTDAGAFFVWGPPGTGKTKVISAAVESAIRNKRSVLITSHTHIAVDNVLQKLMNKGFAVGTMIRVPPTDRTKIAADVRDKGELLTEQAAAILINQKKRLLALQEREAILAEETARTHARVVGLNDELAGFDESELRSARESLRCRDAVELKRRDLAEVTANIRALRQEAATMSASLDREVGRRAQQPDRDALVRDEAVGLSRQSEMAARLANVQVSLEKLSRLRDSTTERLDQARTKLDGTGRVAALFGARSKRSAQIADLVEALATVDVELAANEAQRRSDELAAASAGRHLSGIRRRLRQLEESSRWCEHTKNQLRSSAREMQRLEGIHSALSLEIARLSVQVGDSMEAERVVQRYQELGLEQRAAQREAANHKLARLLAEQAELASLRRQVEADLSVKKDELLRTAPVVACTLSSLAAQQQLIQRTFDVVIVDEVANAQAAQVVYAAAKATGTVALVGDFLQNAPISDVDDPVGPAGALSVAWQKEELFALAGIVDRQTAENHAHCVPLARQYRYPSIVADVVNQFCYDNLLESERASVPADGPTITFVDTSEWASYRLIQQSGSWYNDGGLDIMVAIARSYEVGPGRVPVELGFVTPYAAQKVRAERRVTAEGLTVQCGTSHTFQGKEVPVLIFDMMQDRVDRWVGVANLKGGDGRRVSAAKLLNVAITRMQQRLYVIGDWGYVNRSDQPGMKALASLAPHGNFRLIAAGDLLTGSMRIR